MLVLMDTVVQVHVSCIDCATASITVQGDYQRKRATVVMSTGHMQGGKPTRRPEGSGGMLVGVIDF